ncbi:Uncharacterised protein [Budvicia aquatica]|uniref:Uncharacterized protein n=1 Tax=Budvicia aquatica TaxID=82979 RepID=A0A484ZHK8_9GAMM|nr:Uncharacterised protein [Budvicia aquatica]VFS47161.1 Uncharacterised protein [Budvicia aquatica]
MLPLIISREIEEDPGVGLALKGLARIGGIAGGLTYNHPRSAKETRSP